MDNYKFSYLDALGEQFNGIGIILILNYNDVKYETLFWISKNEEVLKDKLIFPEDLLNLLKIEKVKDLKNYSKILEDVYLALPLKRDEILKEYI